MKKILVTSIGSSSAKTVIKSLKNSNNVVIGCDINEKKYIYSATLVDSFFRVPYYNDPNYLPSLLKIIKKENIDIIIPLTDPEVDILNEIRLKINCLICIPNMEVINVARNKYKLYKFMEEKFSKHKIPTVNNINDISFLDFPIIAKPINGRSSNGVEIIDNVACLDNSKNYDNYIFQTYISGSIYTVDIVGDHFGEIVAVPRKEVLRTVNGLGTSVDIEYHETLIDISISIMKSLHLIGCVNMEFIKSKNRYYLIEINPRFSGGIAFTNLSGYNIVENSILAYTNNSIEKLNIKKNITIIKEYKEYIVD